MAPTRVVWLPRPLYSIVAIFVVLQIWLAATIMLRLSEKKFIRAAIWACCLSYLIYIDVLLFS
jgi:hypothetical protein